LGLAGVVAVGGFTGMISVSLVRYNAATIHGDAIVMTTPIKGVGGVPTRTVRFEDLVDAQPGVRDGLTGAKVLLPGGSS